MELSGLARDITARILIVEDEPLVREMLLEILQQAGHQVHPAASAEEALEALEDAEFDIILSDMHLPGRSGLDLLVRVKADSPLTPFIVVTGQPALDKAIDAMKKGAADFITKPFSADQLHHVINKNLQERRLYVENQRLLAELNNKAVIEKLNRQLHSKITQLEKLYKISESFHSHVDNRSLLQYIVELASELTGSQRVSLLSFDRLHRYLIVRAARGLPADLQQSTTVRVGEGISGKVAASHRPMRVTSENIQRFEHKNGRNYASSSWLSVPLLIGGELFGVLNLTDKRDASDFGEEDEYVVLMLAEKAAIKIENNVLYEGIYESLLDTLKALVSTIEAKDRYTRQHSQRVTEFALALAREVGASEEDCESLAFAGILHDIGKIGIEDSILLKNTRLSDEEYEVIKRHPVIGAQIVEPLGLLPIERAIIRHHHERMDGRGYPDGLQGKEIPLLSRIVSIADSVDAMSSTRSYRRALPPEVVIEELERNAGGQFDPDLAAIMVRLIREGKILREATRLEAIPTTPEAVPPSRASVS